MSSDYFARLFMLSLVAILLTLQLISATPYDDWLPEGIEGVSHIGIDEENGQYVAFRSDGSLHGRFNISSKPRRERRFDTRDYNPFSCSQMSEAALESLPGWSTLAQHVQDTFGSGATFVTNPPEYPNNTLMGCTDGSIVNVALDSSKPNCISSAKNSSGTIVNSTATVKLTFSQGFTSDSTFTVTQESSIAVEARFSATLSFNPQLFLVDVGAETTTTATITNRQTSAFSTTINNIMTQDLWMNNPTNNTCLGTSSVKTCTSGGTGTLNLVAQGWSWANFNSPVPNKADASQGKHYKWATNISSVLPNPSDRTSAIKFIGNLQGVTQINFMGRCDPMIAY